MQTYRLRKFPTRLVLLLLFAAALLFFPQLKSAVKTFVISLVSKPLGVIADARGYLVRLKSLSEENLSLKQRLAMQSVSLGRMREIALENERLRTILDFEKNLRYKSTIARVISRDSTDWRKSIIINKGKTHHIKPHTPCATASGLVGSVAEVYPNSSKVLLITDANSRVAVVLKPSRESGVLVGFSGNMCKVLYISIDADIKKGDEVVTAGFSNYFPKGIVVGRVVDTGVGKIGLYKYAIVKPAVRMNRIEEVICIDVER